MRCHPMTRTGGHDASTPNPRGFFPRLIVRDVDAAIEFCQNAFGAELVERFAEPDGRVGFAKLTLGDFQLSLSEEVAEWGVDFSHVFGRLYSPDSARTRRL
jgi:uncharacterized glyoxalase superfamily protein PhnB